MLSRVAENIYWTARYLERAEGTARLIAVNTELMLDMPKGIAPGWESLLALLGCEKQFTERYSADTDITERLVIRFLLGDSSNYSSILTSLDNARESARTMREIIPRSAWEAINQVYRQAKERLPEGLSKRGRLPYLQRLIQGLQMITGLLSSTLNRDMVYRFLQLGTKIERCDMTTRIIDVRCENFIPQDALELRPFENMLWMNLLRCLNAYLMYCQSMQARIHRRDVLRFLFQSPIFPRSLTYCSLRIGRVLDGLPDSTTIHAVHERLCLELTETPVAEMDNQALHAFIDQIQLTLGELHDVIAQRYFLPQ